MDRSPSVVARMLGTIGAMPHYFPRFFRSWIIAILICSAHSVQAQGITVNFANLDNTAVIFSGGSFSFSSTNGYQFSITSQSGGVGDSVSLQGYIVPGGPFTIGSITTNNTVFGQAESANVSGTAMLHITDQNSVDLTGSIQWDNITTLDAEGALNLTGSINLTALSYNGLNSDLTELAQAGSAADVVTFQFEPAERLDQLDTTGGETSYSGSIGAVPEPAPAFLLLLAGGLWFGARRLRSCGTKAAR